MFKFLIFLIVLTANECNTISKADNTAVNPVNVEETIVNNCNFDFEGKIKPLFNNYFIEEGEIDKDEEFLKEIKAAPHEETINCLLNLQTAKKDDFEMLAKTSYLLIKLGNNKYENGKKLISSYLLWSRTISSWYKDKNYAENVEQGKYNLDFRGDLILSLLGDVIENDNKEILTDTIDLADKTDGASSEIISHIFGGEFEKNPQDFLGRLKPKSKKIRKDIYLFIYYSLGKPKVFQIVSSIPKNSAFYSLASEIKEFARTNKFVSEMKY